jgi:hypothetical protein
MENKYSKIVSKKDFDFDEFVQAYLSKHHNNKDYVTYQLSVFWCRGEDGSYLSLVNNQIKHDGRQEE